MGGLGLQAALGEQTLPGCLAAWATTPSKWGFPFVPWRRGLWGNGAQLWEPQEPTWLSPHFIHA